MKKKYYTPSREEFRIDFEYESKHFIGNPFANEELKKTNWYDKCIINNFNDLSLVDSAINENRLRVKSLDREDIESLRFEKLIKKDIPKCFYPLLDDIEKINSFFQLNSSKIDITWYLQKYHSEYNNTSIKIIKEERFKGNYYNDTIFDGNIKNKSELIVILKQIGIIK